MKLISYASTILMLLSIGHFCLVSSQTGFFTQSANTMALWKFDTIVNGRVDDVSGHDNSATISGNALLQTSQYGKAMSFNGADQFLTITNWDGFKNYGLIEIKCLINPGINAGIHEIITDHHWAGDAKYGFVFRIDKQKLQFAIGTTNGWHYLTDISDISSNTWHVVSVKIDQKQKTVSLKKDSEPELTQVYNGKFNSSRLGLLRIAACSPPPPSRFLNAVIDEIIIDCDEAGLPDSTCFPIDKNTIALWRFNEINNGYIDDVSGNGYNAQLYGTPSLVPAQYSNGLLLDGIDDYLKVINWNSFQDYTNIIIEVLCTPLSFKNDGTANGDSVCEIVNSHQFESKSGYVLRYRNRRAEFAAGASGVWYYVANFDTTKLAAQHYIRGSIDKGGKVITVTEDGIAASDTQFTGNFTPSTDNFLMIGAYAIGQYSRFFHGVIDEIKISGEKVSQLTPRIIAHWTFNEGTGDSAFDSSGNGNHFKLINNPAWVKSKNGNALTFNGVDDYGLCSDLPCQTGMSAITIETVLWIEQSSFTDCGPLIAKWGSGGVTDESWALDIDRRSPYGGHGVVVGASILHINGAKSLPVQRWIHLVFTWSKNEMSLYLDGERVDSKPSLDNGLIQDSDGDMRLAYNTDSNFFSGKIDQISLYNYVLPRDTIKAHFTSLIGQQQEINIGIKTHYSNPGKEIWTPVYLTNYEKNVSVSSIEFSLNIDTSIISFSSVIADSGIASKWTLAHNVFGDSIKFSMGGIGQEISYGEGELLRCKFLIKQSALNGSFSDLLFSDVSIDEGITVHPTTTSGKILIDTIASCYGDVSGNNEVTSFDGAGVVQYVIGMLSLPHPKYPNFTTKIADVSGNGTVSSYDAALIFQYTVGLIDKFPVEQKNLFVFESPKTERPYPHSSLRLVKTSIGPNNLLKYDLIAGNIDGSISADIVFRYVPEIVNLELGGHITTQLHATIESNLDIVNKLWIVSMTTTDDINGTSDIIIASVENVFATDINSVENGIFFKNARIDEAPVEFLSPVQNNVPIATSLKKGLFNTSFINNRSLHIYNIENLPVIVRIYDMHGRVLTNRTFDRFNREIDITLRNLSAGFYYYQITYGKKTLTQKFYLLK